MLLDITPLLRSSSGKQAFSLEWDPNQNWDAMGEEITWLEPVAFTGTCSRMTDFFIVEGEMCLHYSAVCARCLGPVEVQRQEAFEAEFASAEDEDYPDRYLFRGHQLDLTEMAEDLLNLHMPMRHLCKEDCKGLCPVCGANLNTDPCSCGTRVESEETLSRNPFAVLTELMPDEEEEV